MFEKATSWVIEFLLVASLRKRLAGRASDDRIHIEGWLVVDDGSQVTGANMTLMGDDSILIEIHAMHIPASSLEPKR